MGSSLVELSVDPNSFGSNTVTLAVEPQEGTISSLEKIFPDIGGGFSYTKESSITRNRQILWKVVNNKVRLEEISLDHNLFGNVLEIQIPDEVLLPNVVIIEQEQELLVFLATTKTVHQITFVHPNHCKYGFIVPPGVHVAFPSVFNVTPNDYKHKYLILPQQCNNFDVTVSEKDVHFGLVTDSKSLLIASLGCAPEDTSCVELKDATVMQRLWTGLVPSFVRGENTGMDVEDIVMHSFSSVDILGFTLCKDLKIRVWDVKKQSCILVKDLTSLIPEKDDSETETCVNSLRITKANLLSNTKLIVAAHCCFAYSSKFVILEITKEQNDIVVLNVSNFFSSYNSVQSVALSSQHIYALWNTNDGEHAMFYAPIEGGKHYEKGWHPVHTKHLDKEDLYIPLYQDAKEIYLDRLFSPGNLCKESILKALKVFVKTLDIEGSSIPDITSEVSVIKEAVTNVLELEIETNVIARDLDPADYQELQHQCWSKYYSFVQQCYQTREKPLGLYISEDSSFALVIRQDTCGYLISTDWIDHLYLTELDSCEDLSTYIENELNVDNVSLSHDIQIIFQCLKSIGGEFDDEVILGIDQDLDRNEDVKPFLTSMATSLLTNSCEFEQLVGDPIQRGGYLTGLQDRLKHIQEPENSIDVILTALAPSNADVLESIDDAHVAVSSSQFLCGKIGIDIITQILKSQSKTRMHLCRDLFILLKVMDKVGPTTLISSDFGTLKSNTCYELLRSYHAICWSARKPFARTDKSTVDTSLHHLASLHLTERAQSVCEVTDDLPVSLLTSFIRYSGLKNSLTILANRLKVSNSLHELLKIVATSIQQRTWLLNQDLSDFPQFLAAECQYCALMDYLKLCDNWCIDGKGTKDYLLAQAYLGIGEPHKALNYSFSAARGINTKEPFLMSLITEKTGRRDRALVEYFVKVMRLFEQAEFPSYVISAASSALTIAAKDDPNIPMLWSVIFKYHLQLEHYSDAYATIVHNTDRTRRRDCLKHFIVTLCDANLFQEICAYPYTNMEDEVVEIIEARARTMDITVNQYYDLLYSYHVIKGDYRKAASSIYEQSCRLSTEMHGLKSLQKQAKCYLAAIAALKLVPSKDAWIVKYQGKLATGPQQATAEYSQSPKRREDGEEIYYSTSKKKTTKTVIVELEDVEKEYLLIFSRLKLIQAKNGDSLSVGPSLSAAETVGLLAQFGLFDTAFSVALKFKLSLKNIFESLSAKCAQLVKYKPNELDNRWKWLTYNELGTSQILTAKNSTDQAFHLLQIYLKKFQENNSSVYLKAVSSKFLSLGCTLPAWLIQLYELSNPAELLHMYLCYDMVLEATELSLKYVDAILGHGKEHLGLNTALHATTPSVWLPYTSFDQLLSALRANYNKPELAALCEKLQDKLDDYFMKAEIVSLDKLNYLHEVNTSSEVMVET